MPFLVLPPLFAVAMAILILLIRLQKYRIDIPAGASFTDGQSPVWQLNALSPRNYRPDALRTLVWVKILLATLFLGAIVFVVGLIAFNP